MGREIASLPMKTSNVELLRYFYQILVMIIMSAMWQWIYYIIIKFTTYTYNMFVYVTPLQCGFNPIYECDI